LINEKGKSKHLLFRYLTSIAGISDLPLGHTVYKKIGLPKRRCIHLQGIIMPERKKISRSALHELPDIDHFLK